MVDHGLEKLCQTMINHGWLWFKKALPNHGQPWLTMVDWPTMVNLQVSDQPFNLLPFLSENPDNGQTVASQPDWYKYPLY